jgi:hypothetical protein
VTTRQAAIAEHLGNESGSWTADRTLITAALTKTRLLLSAIADRHRLESDGWSSSHHMVKDFDRCGEDRGPC